MNIYLISYYQNEHQKKGILNFIEKQNIELVNKEISKENGLENMLKESDKIWVILPGFLNSGTFYCDIYTKEIEAKKLKKPIIML